MTDALTIQQVQTAMPNNLKGLITQSYVDQINNVATDPIIAEQVRNNFLSYTKVMQDGKYKTQDYLNAVVYISFKLMGMSNQEAYFKTFPDRHADLLAKGTSPKDISAYVSAYNRGKLVNAIFEQTMTPFHVLNQDNRQKAINKLVDLMMNATSEKVQSDSAAHVLNALAPPKEMANVVNFNIGNNTAFDAMADMESRLRSMVSAQHEVIKGGMITARDVAAQPLIEHEDVTDVG